MLHLDKNINDVMRVRISLVCVCVGVCRCVLEKLCFGSVCVVTKLNNSNIKNKKGSCKIPPKEEKPNILNNKLLSDQSINLSQQLLKRQFPIFNGMQVIPYLEHCVRGVCIGYMCLMFNTNGYRSRINT